MLLSLALPTLAHVGMITLLVVGFGFVIFWHELGHFLAAKWVGIRVEQFAVGFGQAMFSWRKGIGFRFGNTQKDYKARIEQHLMAREKSELQFKEKLEFSESQMNSAAEELGLGDTEYRLNWIPLGGYVKMLGQDDLKPDSQAEDPRAYNRKSISARMLVISAGVIMNIILAAIGFMVLFLMGFIVPPAWAGTVVPGSPAQQAGLQVGDHILEFNGKKEADFTKIMLDTALVKEGIPVKMLVDRPDNINDPNTKYHHVDLTVVPARPAGEHNFLANGFSPPRALRGDKKDDETPAPIDEQKLALIAVPDMTLIRPGYVITAINGQAITPDGDIADPEKLGGYVKLDAALQASHGNPISLTVKRDDGSVHEKQMIQPHFEIPFAGEFSMVGFVPRVAIGSVGENSPLFGQLHPMDIISEIHDSDPYYHPSREVFMKHVGEDGKNGRAMDITVIRDGKELPPFQNVKASVKVAEGRMGLSVMPMLDEQHTVVADVLPGSPAEQAGIKGGDTVTSVDGKPVTTWFEVQQILADLKIDKDAKSVAVKLTYTRPQLDKPQEGEMQLTQDQLDAVKSVRYGSLLALGEFDIKRQTSHPLQAAAWGITETRDFILQFYLTLRRMVNGSVSPSNMMGPLGIFGAGKTFAYKGADWLLWFLAMISANLAVVNFLPIPVVDGGQFMFLIFEKIKGKPLSPKAMTIAQYAGLAFLAAVVLFVTFHDIVRMWG